MNGQYLFVLCVSMILCFGATTQNLSERCQEDYDKYETALAQNEMWARLMADANGKPGAGQLSGDRMFEGDYDTCQRARQDPEKADPIRGMYCITWWPFQNVTYPWFPGGFGFCIPDQCNHVDAGILAETLNPHEQRINRFSVQWYCPKTLNISTDPAAIVAIVILSIVGGLVFASSVVDYHQTRKRKGGKPDRVEVIKDKDMPNEDNSVAMENLGNNNFNTEECGQGNTKSLASENGKTGKMLQAFLCFSLFTNVPRLFSTKHPPGSYPSLHGIRVLAMTSIVLCHSYNLEIFATDPPVTRNYNKLITEYFGLYLQPIFQMKMSVNTFFVLGSVLVSVSFMKTLEKRPLTFKGLLKHYFHRYCRLTPVYAAVLMVYICLILYFQEGPYNKIDQSYYTQCKNLWITKLLYIDLLSPTLHLCMGWTWYLTCDFQFYIMAPFFLYFAQKVWKRKRSTFGGTMIFMAGFLGSFVITAMISFLCFFRVIEDDFTSLTYFRPWSRASTYFLGLTLGFYLYVNDFKFAINKVKLSIGWVVAALLFISTMYGDYLVGRWDFSDFGVKMPETVYRCVKNTLFDLSILWLVFVCMTGNGGLINWLMSLKFWLPLSRLSYAMYLVHAFFNQILVRNFTVQLHVSHWMMLYIFIGHLILSLLAGIVATLMFEMPFTGMEKLLWKKKLKSQQGFCSKGHF